ncbi:hypothetical protein EDD15DRAFT_2304051 [Pisolithus albus]|nr:hypothetical protein EDD15DRAFT_2304051 [Pisolithus albus]
MVDVIDCPGCCDGPRRTTITFNDWRGLDTPGLMNTVSRSYCLEVEEPPDSGRRQPQFDVCSRQRFALGDYGDYSPGNLVCTGNIFEDMPIVGFDHKDPAYCPTAFNVPCPGLGILMYPVEFGDDFALAYRHMDTSLALRQPKRISLPANEHISLLLKALSTRLAGKYLVTTIIQCSDFYTVDRHGNRWGSSDDSPPADSHHFTEARIQTLLCTIASPQVWRRECVCKQRMERFKSIREHFDALVDMSANKQTKDVAIEFFSNLFGLKYLKIYVSWRLFNMSSYLHLPWNVDWQHNNI